MITKEEIADQLLQACPSFKPIYGESENKDLLYSLGGDFAHHLLTLLQNGETSEFPAVAEMIEHLYFDGDSYMKEFATISLLEGIQNVWSNKGTDAEIFGAFLLPLSKKYWQSLKDFWDGKVPYVGYGIEAVGDNKWE